MILVVGSLALSSSIEIKISKESKGYILEKPRYIQGYIFKEFATFYSKALTKELQTL